MSIKLIETQQKLSKTVFFSSLSRKVLTELNIVKNVIIIVIFIYLNPGVRKFIFSGFPLNIHLIYLHYLKFIPDTKKNVEFLVNLCILIVPFS